MVFENTHSKKTNSYLLDFFVTLVEIKRDYLDYGYFFAIIVVFILFFTGFFSSLSGYTLVVIENPDPNSMYPSYFQGDLFMIKDSAPGQINLGDVVVYEKPSGDRIIHRIIDIQVINGDYFYRIKGDNPVSNFQPDTIQVDNVQGHLIPHNALLGKVVYRIPFLGHLSLAMQRNPTIQLLVYVFAATIAAAIIFWPENKDEENKDGETIIINSTTIKALFSSIVFFPKNFISDINNRKERRIMILGISIIVFLLILPLFILFLIPVNGGGDIGVKSIEIRDKDKLTLRDSVNGQDYLGKFIQARIELFDNTGALSGIDSFVLEVFLDSSDPSTRISQTVWKSLHDFSGIIVVGGSIVIQLTDLPTQTTPLDIKVTVKINSLFSSSTQTAEISYIFTP